LQHLLDPVFIDVDSGKLTHAVPDVGLDKGGWLNVMATGNDDDKDLREVKAVLRGLQRIGGDRLPQTETASKNHGSVVATGLENPAPLRPGIRSGAPEPLADKRPVQGKRLAALALAMLAAGTVIVLAGDLFLKYWPTISSSRPAAIGGGDISGVATTERAGAKISIPVPIETSQPVLPTGTSADRAASSAGVPTPPDIVNAHELMDSGHIAAARDMLLRPDLAASQEGAWLLARSYDPNYLATIKSPDASPDKRQAEEWYRRWRDIGVRNGMDMDDLRLKRIINSMR
jgi:hypothetical protein